LLWVELFGIYFGRKSGSMSGVVVGDGARYWRAILGDGARKSGSMSGVVVGDGARYWRAI
jgi:hypothetical protein